MTLGIVVWIPILYIDFEHIIRVFWQAFLESRFGYTRNSDFSMPVSHSPYSYSAKAVEGLTHV